MTPALARIKRGVRAAIAACGGVDGAGATAGRCRSVAGDWGNLAHQAFPPIDCALALDEVAIAQGKVPPIVTALAAELGGLFVCRPEGGAPIRQAQGDRALPGQVMLLAKEFGDLSGAVSTGLADGTFTPGDAELALEQLSDVERVSAALRLALEALRLAPEALRAGIPSRRAEERGGADRTNVRPLASMPPVGHAVGG